MAIKRIDILEDENGDELIENGDFAIGESDGLHVRDLLLDAPGDWRQYPQVGMLIARFRNASSVQKPQFESELRATLTADGYKVKSVTFQSPKWWIDFVVDAEAIK